MPTYHVRTIAKLDEGTVVEVKTGYCSYHVAEKAGTVTVYGPGVEVSYEVGEELPDDLSVESLALVAVLLWED